MLPSQLLERLDATQLARTRPRIQVTLSAPT